MADMEFTEVCDTGQWLLSGFLTMVEHWDFPIEITICGVKVDEPNRWAHEYGELIDAAVYDRAHTIAQHKMVQFEDQLDGIVADVRESVRAVLNDKYGMELLSTNDWLYDRDC